MKTMKKYLIVLVAGLLATVVSCEKNFDVKYSGYLTGSSASQMVSEDPSFLSSYVQGLYSWMITPGIAYDGHDDFGYLSCLMISDFMGQDVVLEGSQNWGAFDYQFTYGGAIYVRVYQYWSEFFTLINNSNAIIDFFVADQDPTDATSRGYLGQAYAARALAYMNLVLYFQDPVTGTTPNAVLRTDAPTIPLVYASRDGIDPDLVAERQGRVPMNIVMEHIEYNIEQALKFLDGYTRTSKNEIDYSVAQGIAARYYLFTQQWDKAVEAAHAARQGYTLMDQTRLMAGFMDVDDPEVMWGFNETTETQTTYASFFSHMSNDSPGYAGLDQPSKLIDRSLYEQIPNSDWRKAMFNGPDGDPDADPSLPGSARPYAARKFGFADQWLQDYIYMRAAEMYLIEAEGYARMGDTGNATSVLKELMTYRNPAWSGTADVDEILLQRRIELWGEGVSYFDLRRNGLGIERSYSGTNHPVWGRIDVPAHDPLWNFQIPQSEIDNNDFIGEEDQNEYTGEPS